MPAQAQEAGKTYTISSADNTIRSLFVTNSSLAERATVVGWTETDVPAQQWTLEVSDEGTYMFRNVHSGYYLARATSSFTAVLQQCDLSVGDRARWNIKPIEGSNEYIISPATSDAHAISVSALTDGAAVNSARLNTEDPKQHILLKEVEPKDAVTNAMKAEMMAKFVDKFLVSRSSSTATFGAGGGWGDAEMLETVLDAFETTGDKTYLDIFNKVYGHIYKYLGIDYCKSVWNDNYKWFGNEYNDDVMWLVIAVARASFLTGESKYLTYARNNFNKVYSRALLPIGTMRWAEGHGDGTNSCINFPTVVAACYIAKGMGTEEYYQKALELYTHARGRLFNPADGHVYDSTSMNGDTGMYGYNTWASTYNQGTFIGAALMLYEHYRDESLANDARMAFQFVKNNMCNTEGVLHVCQTVSGDLCGFKGILMRYVRRVAVDLNDIEAMAWLQRQALFAFSNRNSSGITSSCWLTKSGEDWKVNGDADFSNEPFGCSTAVSAVVNAPIGHGDFYRNAYESIPAEKFNYMKGLLVLDGTNENEFEVQSGKTGYFAAYNNVDFGRRPANKMNFRISPVNADGLGIEVYADSLKGRLLGTLSLNQCDTWNDYSIDLLPIEGLHNIYLRFANTSAVTYKNYTIDSFCFDSTMPVFTASLMNLAGTITATDEVENSSYLIDTHLSTQISIPSGTAFTYRGKARAKLMSYSIVAPDDPTLAPKAWLLEASFDNEKWIALDRQTEMDFDVPGEKKSFVVDEKNYYLYYRLTVEGSCDTVALSEWQLFGRSEDGNCITTDGGSFSTDTPQQKLYAAKGCYIPTAYSITCNNTAPKTWVLEGSSNNASWTVLDRCEDETFCHAYSSQFYNIDTADTYSYFRLTVDGEQTDDFRLNVYGHLHSSATLYHGVLNSGGELSSSDGQGNETLLAAVDNDVRSCVVLPWNSESCYLQYNAPMDVRPLSYGVAGGKVLDNNPRMVQLDASNDGQTWTKLSASSISFNAKGAVKEVNLNTTKTYRYFRLSILRAVNEDATEINISEWQLNGTAISQESLAAQGTINVDGPEKQASESAAMLIDGNKDTKVLYQCFVPSKVVYEAPAAQKVNLYSITAANDAEGRDPQEWTFEASNDGETWIVLDSRKDELFKTRFATQFYSFYNEQEYKYYRLNIKRVRGNGDFLCQMAELQMFYSETVAAGIEDKSELLVRYDDGKLSIVNEKSSVINIYDVAGRLVDTIAVPTGQSNVNINLPHGLYIIKVGGQVIKIYR